MTTCLFLTVDVWIYMLHVTWLLDDWAQDLTLDSAEFHKMTELLFMLLNLIMNKNS